LEESINNIEEFSNSIVQSPKKTKGIQSVKSTPIIFKEGQKKIKDVDFNKLVQNSGYKKLQFNRFSAGSFKDSDHEQSNEKRQQIEGCIEEEKKAN